jgi:hypothetical protein
MICSVEECNIELELELSLMVEICRWCREELQPDWEDWQWERDFEMSIHS